MNSSLAVVPMADQWNLLPFYSPQGLPPSIMTQSLFIPQHGTMEMNRLKNKLSLAEQTIAELEAQVNELSSLPQQKHEEDNAKINEQKAKLVEWQSVVEEFVDLLGQFLKKNPEAEKLFNKLISLFLSENDQCFTFFKMVKDRFFDGQGFSFCCEKLDQFSTLAQDQLELGGTQYPDSKIRMGGMRPVIKGLIKLLKGEKIKKSIVVQAEPEEVQIRTEPETPLQALQTSGEIEENLEIPCTSAHSSSASAEEQNSFSTAWTTPAPPSHVGSSSSSFSRLLSPTKILIKISPKPAPITHQTHARNMAKHVHGFFCICGSKFFSRKKLEVHFQVKNQTLVQPPTPSTSTSSRKLPKERVVQHGINPSNPNKSICGYQSGNKICISNHVACYNTGEKFECEYCPKQFVSMAYLRLHLVKDHQVSKEMATSGFPNKPNQQNILDVGVPSSSSSAKQDDDFYEETAPFSPQPTSNPNYVADNDDDEEDEITEFISELEPATAAASPPLVKEEEEEEQEEDQEEQQEIKKPLPKRRGRRHLPHGYSKGKFVSVIQCICGKIFKDSKKLRNHINYYNKVQHDDYEVTPRPASIAKRQSPRGRNLKDKMDSLDKRPAAGPEVCMQRNDENTSPHQEVSIGKLEMYTCACGSEHAVRTSLIDHITVNK